MHLPYFEVGQAVSPVIFGYVFIPKPLPPAPVEIVGIPPCPGESLCNRHSESGVRFHLKEAILKTEVT